MNISKYKYIGYIEIILNEFIKEYILAHYSNYSQQFIYLKLNGALRKNKFHCEISIPY